MSDVAFARVVAIFTDIVGCAPTRGPDTLPRDMPLWDSLSHIKFVHALEREFRCELPEEYLLPGKRLGDFTTAAAGR